MLLLSLFRVLATIRETEIIDLLLKQSWIHLGKGGGELSRAEKGAPLKKDFNVNGFNSFY